MKWSGTFNMDVDLSNTFSVSGVPKSPKAIILFILSIIILFLLLFHGSISDYLSGEEVNNPLTTEEKIPPVIEEEPYNGPNRPPVFIEVTKK